MSKHTPGEWKAVEREDGSFDIIEGFRDSTCVVAQVVTPTTLNERKANARLIAAAPDLLGALNSIRLRMRQGIASDSDLQRIYEIIDTAIFKAEGRES